MKRLVLFLGLACLCFVFYGKAEADVFVKASAKVQDVADVTPIEGLKDTVSFTVQVGTKITDITSVSVVLQRINDGATLAGVQVDYAVPLNLATALSPYVGFAASINLTEMLDNGVILSGIAGIEIRFTEMVSAFVEGRSLTWYTGEKNSAIGVGTGVMLEF